MPTDDELSRLPETREVEILADDTEKCKIFEAETTKESCFWPGKGKDAGTKIGRGGECAFLGYSAQGFEVWASLMVSGPYGCCCDAPHRAFLRLQVINDRRDSPDVRAVLIAGLMKMTEVTNWDQGIQGNTLQERYAFVYDVLLDEAKNEWD